jgi:hypothetical protein
LLYAEYKKPAEAGLLQFDVTISFPELHALIDLRSGIIDRPGDAACIA